MKLLAYTLYVVTVLLISGFARANAASLLPMGQLHFGFDLSSHTQDVRTVRLSSPVPTKSACIEPVNY